MGRTLTHMRRKILKSVTWMHALIFACMPTHAVLHFAFSIRRNGTTQSWGRGTTYNLHNVCLQHICNLWEHRHCHAKDNISGHARHVRNEKQQRSNKLTNRRPCASICHNHVINSIMGNHVVPHLEEYKELMRTLHVHKFKLGASHCDRTPLIIWERQE